jgi:hypothetical protein
MSLFPAKKLNELISRTRKIFFQVGTTSKLFDALPGALWQGFTIQFYFDYVSQLIIILYNNNQVA